MQQRLSMVLAFTLALCGAATADPVRIVALGDSNTAGFLVGKRNAFPAVVERSLKEAGYDVSIVNRGISGDTTGGMLARLDDAVPAGTRIAIVQGGYNDLRRGATPRQVSVNIDRILSRLAARRVKVVLCGYSGAQWGSIARRHGAVIVPPSTCYDAGSRGFDGLHMNRAGHRIVGARMAPVIERLLGRASG